MSSLIFSRKYEGELKSNATLFVTGMYV